MLLFSNPAGTFHQHEDEKGENGPNIRAATHLSFQLWDEFSEWYATGSLRWIHTGTLRKDAGEQSFALCVIYLFFNLIKACTTGLQRCTDHASTCVIGTHNTVKDTVKGLGCHLCVMCSFSDFSCSVIHTHKLWVCTHLVSKQQKSLDLTVIAYFCPLPVSIAGYEPEWGEAAASEGERHYD